MAGLGRPGGMMPHNEAAETGEPMNAPASEEMTEDHGGQPASPKEQQALEQFVRTAQDVIYPSSSPGQVFPQIMADLKGQFDQQVQGLFADADPPLSGQPGDNVAATSVLVTLVVDSKMGLLEQALSQGDDDQGAQTGGEEFQADAVLMQGGKEIVEMLVETAEAAKIHDFSEDDVQQVFLRALDLFRFAASKVDPRLVQSLQRGFAQLVEADRAGRLTNILPGLPGGQPMGQQR